MNQIAKFEELVMRAGDDLVTDTKKVAAHFGKQHRKVTRDVDALILATGEWGAANFGHTLVANRQNGQSYRAYQMTKDGFMLLAMGFTGARALATKLAFISAFNNMAEQIKSSNQGLWKQMQDLIAREVGSQVRASFGSHLMLTRKRELPALRDERHLLEDAIQPSLLN